MDELGVSHIDAALSALEDFPDATSGPNPGTDYLIWRAATSAWQHQDDGQTLVLGPYTSSIDAIKHLAERCLPGWGWRVGTCCVSDDAWLFPDTNHPSLGHELAGRYAHLRDPVEWFLEKTDVDLRPPGRQAIAMCISFLLALKYLDGR